MVLLEVLMPVLKGILTTILFAIVMEPICFANPPVPDAVAQNTQMEQKWRILIAAEHDPSGFIAGNPAYKRVNNAIFTQLQRAGFDVLSLVIDENLPACLVDVCEGKTEQDIVTLVKTSDANIDLLVLFSIRYVERQGAAMLQREISVPSRMVDVKTGRRVGLWDDDGIITQSIPDSCVDGCLRKRLSDFARQIGRDTGLVISHKLQDYQRLFDYHLMFTQFARGELLRIEKKLNTAARENGIRHINEGSENPQRVLFHHLVDKTLMFESTLPPVVFRQLLEQALDEQGASASISVDEHQFHIARDGFPYLWRYLNGGLLFILFVFLAVLFVACIYRKSRHKKLLKQLIDMQQNLSNVHVEDFYVCLMAVHRLLDKTKKISCLNESRQDLYQARKDYIRQFNLLTGDALTNGDMKNVRFLISDNVDIGRGNDNKYGSIALGFKRLSHTGKQNNIERHANGFSVSDRNSTNGSWLDEMRLVKGRLLSLVKERHTLYLGGSLRSEERGLCLLNLVAPQSSSGSLMISVDTTAVVLSEKSYASQNWPNLEYDRQQTWVMLGNRLALGIDGAHWDIGCVGGSIPLVFLAYKDGSYWVSPVSGANRHLGLQVNNVIITTEVPLIVGAKIKLGNMCFGLLPQEEKSA